MVIELNDPQQNKKGAAGSFFLNIDTASEIIVWPRLIFEPTNPDKC